jgi:hypothetical protein
MSKDKGVKKVKNVPSTEGKKYKSDYQTGETTVSQNEALPKGKKK